MSRKFSSTLATIVVPEYRDYSIATIVALKTANIQCKLYTCRRECCSRRFQQLQERRRLGFYTIWTIDGMDVINDVHSTVLTVIGLALYSVC